jgi:hypothetical protein
MVGTSVLSEQKCHYNKQRSKFNYHFAFNSVLLEYLSNQMEQLVNCEFSQELNVRFGPNVEFRDNKFFMLFFENVSR